MSSWIFQGNPDFFDLDKYLANNDEITWSVKQKHFINKIMPGDEVFIWKASGNQKALSGVVAVCEVLDVPEIFKKREDLKYWLDKSKIVPEHRVRLAMLQRNLGVREIVKRKWCKDDPILKSLRILSIANETNYILTSKEAQRLDKLVEHTGFAWNWDECVAGLWAYNETYQKPVSRAPGSPISIIALTIGRAVSGVYNKVMNFRAIDQRCGLKGLPNKNQLDCKVWKHYYDTSKSELKVKLLQKDFSALWIEKITTIHNKKYKDFGEAPNDNTKELSLFARKVRKGQKAFRENLLEVYDGKCVVTGCAIEPTLNAAHIQSHAECGINRNDNGLLLRSDIHDLYDAHLIKIDPDTLRITVSEEIINTSYGEYHNKKISERVDGGRPGRKYLRQHQKVTSKSEIKS